MLYRCVCLATGGQTSVETESVKRLGITRSSHDDIKKAYRKKAMTHHPGQENIIETRWLDTILIVHVNFWFEELFAQW